MGSVAVIGGGLAGISCALHLAEHGVDTELFEAAPRLGGRTSSFHDEAVDAWVDNGPHLLIGAYHHARDWFARHGVTDLAWQPQLRLPLWEAGRGHFALEPGRRLPLPLSLAWATSRLPGHGLETLLAMRRLGSALRRPIPADLSVEDWLAGLRIPTALRRDLLHPLCLGAMNEPATGASAASFAQVLHEAFAGHDAARLGWFTRPFAQALLAPLAEAMQRHGVRVHLSARVTGLHETGGQPEIALRTGPSRRFARVVLAMPAQARNRLLGLDDPVATLPITNVHLWFDEDLGLPHPLVGGIGTLGHWFFDVTQQMPGMETGALRHLCAVVSAARPGSARDWTPRLCDELRQMLGRHSPLRPHHVRIVHEQRATTLVRAGARPRLPQAVFDAGEQPRPGELPATIETAVMRGLDTAALMLSQSVR